MSRKRRNNSPGAQRWRERESFRRSIFTAVVRDEIERQIIADQWQARNRGEK